MPAGLLIWAANVNLFIKKNTAWCRRCQLLRRGRWSPARGKPSLSVLSSVPGPARSRRESPGKAQSSSLSSRELEWLWPRKSRKLSPRFFFCCLLHFKTVQKDFSLWKRLTMVFSRVHVLRTSSQGCWFTGPSGIIFVTGNLTYSLWCYVILRRKNCEIRQEKKGFSLTLSLRLEFKKLYKFQFFICCLKLPN